MYRTFSCSTSLPQQYCFRSTSHNNTVCNQSTTIYTASNACGQCRSGMNQTGGQMFFKFICNSSTQDVTVLSVCDAECANCANNTVYVVGSCLPQQGNHAFFTDGVYPCDVVEVKISNNPNCSGTNVNDVIVEQGRCMNIFGSQSLELVTCGNYTAPSYSSTIPPTTAAPPIVTTSSPAAAAPNSSNDGPAFKRLIVVKSLKERDVLNVAVRLPAPALSVTLQHAYSGSGFDYITVGSANCTSLLDPNGTCFALQSCPVLNALFPVVSDTLNFFVSDVYRLRLRFGPLVLSNSQCFSSTAISVSVLMAEVPFLAAALYRRAFVAPTADIPTSVGSISAWLLQQKACLGPASGLKLFDQIAQNLTLQPTPLTAVIPSSIVLFAPPAFDELATPIVSNFTSPQVQCIIPDVSTFSKVVKLANTINLGTSYSLDCSYAAMAVVATNLQVLCTADETCLGYTTCDSSTFSLPRWHNNLLLRVR